jgi:hypothetical protein
MKKETPFNPIPLPENLKLSMSAEPARERASSGGTGPERPRMPNAGKRSRKTKQAGSDEDESRWNRVKDRFVAKVAAMDKDKLKAVLVTCGVAVGVAAAVIAAIKLMPVTVLILAILGVGAALRFWDKLRYFPHPF